MTRALALVRQSDRAREQIGEMQLELDHYRQLLIDVEFDQAEGEGRR
jgi:hypothetical protein